MLHLISLLLVGSSSALIPVPYLGPEEPYFVGNGIAGAGGDTRGKWDFLIGPDYTSPDFLESEILFLELDGRRFPLEPQMHRVQGTGIFSGKQTIEGMEVTVSDFDLESQPWVCRSIDIANLTTSHHQVAVVAEITPGQTQAVTLEAKGLRITSPNGSLCFGDETKNWADRTSVIAFSGGGITERMGQAFVVRTAPGDIGPRWVLTNGLYHWQAYGKGEKALALIAKRNSWEDLSKARSEWKAWFKKGLDIPRTVKNVKAANVIEGSLVACRSQQNRDGGTIAGTRRYANSYIRDTHGAVRLFLATGHTQEAKRAIETIHHKWSVAGFIPNWWSMGSDSFIGHSFLNDRSEITGYYTLMVRDYLAATKDQALVERVWPSVKAAVDGQLLELETNNWRITFNGDETEQYCVKKDGETYGGFPAFPQWNSKAWSFPSAAIACASVQFFVDRLRARTDPLATEYEAKLFKLRASIDETFWNGRYHVWARYPDGSLPTVRIPNYGLIPFWVGAKLNYGRQDADAHAAASLVDIRTGYLATAPGEVDGYCGHNLGYLLYATTKLKDPMAERVFHLMLNGRLLGCWGTVSEFYGPNGVPNGHNYRVFESGINAEALLAYFRP